MARAPAPVLRLIDTSAAMLGTLRRRGADIWFAGPLHQLLISTPRPRALAARPCDFRPGDPGRGEEIMRGEFFFAGEGMQVAAGDNPWRRLTPSHQFAVALHSFDWARDLVAVGAPGADELLRQWFGWRRVFGRYQGFAWSGLALERRVFNLACAASAVAPIATEAESAMLAHDLARQARHLARTTGDRGRTAERAATVAVAGLAIGGRAGEGLLAPALKRLAAAVGQAVLPDGVHASRSPERGLDLLFDLMTLDDALSRAGAPAPAAVARAMDRLAAAVRFFAMADGRLAAFQGGEPGSAELVAAALALGDAEERMAASLPYGGYERMECGPLQLIADAGAPPSGLFAERGCAQTGALAIACAGQTLVVGSGWSARGEAREALRHASGGSCLDLRPLPHHANDWRGVARTTKAERHGDAGEAWLDISHDGWAAEGFACLRRLYLNEAAGELRGEDTLTPTRGPRAATEADVRFRLAHGVHAEVVSDGRSAVLHLPDGAAWRLRTDAETLRLDPGAVFERGEARGAHVLTLSSLATPEAGVRIRWRLARDA